RIAQRDTEEAVKVGRGTRAGYEEMRISRHDPREGGAEARVQERVPDREEAAERAVLQVDVVPAVKEQTRHERHREQTGHEIFAPDRFRTCLRPHGTRRLHKRSRRSNDRDYT